MSENVIFCYSGTGNCLDMAKTIARELGDTDIILMRKEPAVTDVRDAKRVGFAGEQVSAKAVPVAFDHGNKSETTRYRQI